MNKHWYQKWWGIMIILMIVIIVSFVFAFFLYVVSIVKETKNNQLYQYSLTSQNQDPETMKIINGASENYWFGTQNPKITIVEFGDYACPFCKKSHSKIREISLKYKDYVKYVYRNFPIITEHSGDLALSAECAGEQGLFWVMHDKLFINQGITTQDEIYELAKQAGVNEEKFNICFTSKKYLPDIQTDLADGTELGVYETPTWFINGNEIIGDIPYELFIKLIEDLITLK